MWKAAMEREAGRLRAPAHLADVLGAQFRLLPADAQQSESAAMLPPHHGDPFDRGLIAHALRDDLIVMTHDEVFVDYGVRIAPR